MDQKLTHKVYGIPIKSWEVALSIDTTQTYKRDANHDNIRKLFKNIATSSSFAGGPH